MRPQVGQVVHNKYRLIRLIGDGGMGSVFEARHEVLGMSVALKFLHPELSRRSGLVQRFLQEARVSAQIQSPHVVRVTDVDQTPEGQAFIVMEYLEGKTLQTLYEDLYHARQRLPYAEALELAIQMLEGVEAAHSAGVVHRDLKPDNVIITKGKRGEPVVKLLDFGIAKLKVTGQLDRGLTRPGIIMGTPEYMAPEQAYSADAVDQRADIFSLGVMIFEMLAGRRPVGGDEPHQIATAYLTRNISKLADLAPSVPADLATAVHRAMGPKPEDRFNSVAELRAAIEPFWLQTRSNATPLPAGATPAPASPAPVGASPAPVGEAPRRVPKTLPPEEEAAAAPVASLAPATTPVSQLPDMPVGPAPEVVSLEVPSSISVDLASLNAAAQAGPNGKGTVRMSVPAALAATAAAEPLPPPPDPGAPFPGTVESPPYIPPGKTNPGAPDAASFSAQPPTVEAPPLDFGGNNGASTAAMAPLALSPAGGTAVGAMQASAAMPPTASFGPATAPSPAGRRGRSAGASFALILIAATAVAGVVVGGVYFANERAKGQDQTDDAPTAPPPATVTADSPPQPTGPQAKPPPQITNRPPPPLPPGPRPPTTGTPTAQPSTSPTTFPTAIPTGIPSGFPTAIPTSLFPIPLPPPTFFPPFPFPTPQQQPGGPPSPSPSPAPSGTSTSTKTKIIIHLPGTPKKN